MVARSHVSCAVTTLLQVDAYVEAAGRKSDFERTELAKDKTGVFTGGC